MKSIDRAIQNPNNLRALEHAGKIQVSFVQGTGPSDNFELVLSPSEAGAGTVHARVFDEGNPDDINRFVTYTAGSVDTLGASEPQTSSHNIKNGLSGEVSVPDETKNKIRGWAKKIQGYLDSGKIKPKKLNI
jgi:hypothetical protein